MSKKKWMRWLLLLALIIPLALVACGGEEEPAEEPVAETAEEVEQEVEEAAEEVEEEVEEAAEEAEEVVEEEAAEEEMAEEEVAEEEMAEEEAAEVTSSTMNGIDECVVATEGPFAGVDPTGVEITWWHQHSGEDRDNALATIVGGFNDTNACGITVVDQNQGGYNDIRDKVNASITAGELPAALVVGYQNDQAFYQLNNALVDLDPYLTSDVWGLTDADREDFFASFVDQSIHPSFGGQRLGFPPNRSMEVLFYNETWLEELGYEGPPTTPDEFREMACAASNAEGTGGYILRSDASAVAAWAMAFGGDVLAEDGESYNYANEATIESMAFLKDLTDDGCAYFFTEGYPNPEFAARNAIFAQGSSSGLPFYFSDVQTVAEEQGTEPDEWGVTAIPHTVENPVQNIYGADVMITNTTPEQQLAAWIFVKWFTLPENQAEWVRGSNYFPTRRGTQEYLGDYVAENPQWGTALDLLQYGAYEPQLISYQSVRDEAEIAFNTIMQLPEDVGVDNTDPIVDILEELTDFANEQQEELMAEIE